MTIKQQLEKMYNNDKRLWLKLNQISLMVSEGYVRIDDEEARTLATLLLKNLDVVKSNYKEVKKNISKVDLENIKSATDFRNKIAEAINKVDLSSKEYSGQPSF